MPEFFQQLDDVKGTIRPLEGREIAILATIAGLEGADGTCVATMKKIARLAGVSPQKTSEYCYRMLDKKIISFVSAYTGREFIFTRNQTISK